MTAMKRTKFGPLTNAGFLRFLRVLVKSDGFNMEKPYVEANPGEHMRLYGVLMSKEMISVIGRSGGLEDRRWECGFKKLMQEGLIK